MISLYESSQKTIKVPVFVQHLRAVFGVNGLPVFGTCSFHRKLLKGSFRIVVKASNQIAFFQEDRLLETIATTEIDLISQQQTPKGLQIKISCIPSNKDAIEIVGIVQSKDYSL